MRSHFGSWNWTWSDGLWKHTNGRPSYVVRLDEAPRLMPKGAVAS